MLADPLVLELNPAQMMLIEDYADQFRDLGFDLELFGNGSIITTGHKIDFTDRVDIGRRTIIGGRNSSIWTHNRQRTQPIHIGEFAYVGSEIRMAPGSALPSRCVVGIGAAK